MKPVSRVTVSVPAELLEAVDHKLTRDGETRSAVIRRLIEDALREVAEQEDIERYLQGYREHPQTEEEFGWSDAVASEHLTEASWT